MTGQTNRLAPGIAGRANFEANGEKPASLEERIALAEAIKAQLRQVERIKSRLGREKQFNKRVAINAELRAAKQELERLVAGTAATAVTNYQEDDHG